MSSSEYWTEKTVSWRGIGVGLAIWIFALAVLLLLADTAIYLKLMTSVSSGTNSPL